MNIQEFRAQNPEYNDMSDAELSKALHGKFYSDMPYGEFASSFGVSSGPSGLGRAVGLSARDLIMGMGGLPMMVGDALNAGVDYASAGINKVTGSSIPRLGRVSDAAEQMLDRVGLPRPQGRTEENVSAVGRALTGAGAAKGAADMATRTLNPTNPMAQKFLAMMSDNIGAQTAAGLGSVASMDVARNAMDVQNPMGLMAAGMMGGMIAPSSGTIVKEGVKAAVQPFSQKGREVMVGNTLKALSAAPDTLTQRLDNARMLVPGSLPTTAAASRDVGLAGAENAIRGLDDQNRFAVRIGQNNVARMNEFDRIAGVGKIDGAKAKRTDVTAPMRDNAFANAGPVDAAPVLGMIDNILASPVGKRADVQSALNWAKSRLEMSDGDPRTLYEIRKDLAGAMQGKYDKDMPSLRLAKGQLGSVVRAVDQTIEAAAPGYGQYMSKFATMSKPIDQMKLLQEVRGMTTRGVGDGATGQDVLTASALRNQLASRAGDIKETLSTTQQRVLDKIINDIDRAQISTAPGVKSPGSDTFKNMSVGNMIGRMWSQDMASNTTLRTITRPLDWLYKLPDQAITQLLVESMLDPALASELVKKANVMRIEPVSRQLKDKAAQMGYGAIVNGQE